MNHIREFDVETFEIIKLLNSKKCITKIFKDVNAEIQNIITLTVHCSFLHNIRMLNVKLCITFALKMQNIM